MRRGCRKWLGAFSGPLVLVAAMTACRPPRLEVGSGVGPLRTLHGQSGPHGGLLATMGGGTQGTSVLELPSRDILLAGSGETGFVERNAPGGPTRWTLRTCPAPAIASTGDDAIYALATAFLDVSGGPGALEPYGYDACKAFATVPPPRTSLVRLDGRGALRWKLETGLCWSDSLVASKDHVFVFGRGDHPVDRRSTILAVNGGGQVEWTWEGQAASIAWSPARRVLVAAGEDRSWGESERAACSLIALDDATGKPVWKRGVGFYDTEDPGTSNRTECVPDRILVSPRGVVLLGQSLSDGRGIHFVVGLDPATGAVRWKRSIEVTDFVAGPPLAPPNPSMPLLLLEHKAPLPHHPLRSISGPIAVAIEADTGRLAPVFPFHAYLPGDDGFYPPEPDEPIQVTLPVWGRDGHVLATGSFFGRLTLGGLQADSDRSTFTRCRNPDPMYGPGDPVDQNGHCFFGTEDVLRYERTLFVARLLPSGSP